MNQFKFVNIKAVLELRKGDKCIYLKWGVGKFKRINPYYWKVWNIKVLTGGNHERLLCKQMGIAASGKKKKN